MRQRGALVVALSLLLLVSFVGALTIGPAEISAQDVAQTALYHLGLWPDPPVSRLRDAIVWDLRLPRILAAASVGAGLALCGAVMQALTRNPLADPYLLGLSAGASCGAVVCLVLGATLLLPVGAFIGALVALALTLSIAQSLGGASPSRTILAGIAVTAAMSALASFLIFWTATGDSYREILSWLLGSMSGIVWSEALLTGAAVLVGGTVLLCSGRALDVLVLGNDTGAALGIPLRQARWLLLGLTALLTGVLVSVAGSVGFIGLVVPHAARFVASAKHRSMLSVTALLGAIFMLWSDTAARTLFDPRELPVGIVTALIGAPLFLIVLLRFRRAT